jgi:lysophospholipase L1-like esterase
MRLFFILSVCFYMGGSSRTSAAARQATPAIFQQLVTTYFDGVTRKDFSKLAAVTTPDFVIYEFGKKWTNDSVFHNIQYHEPFGVTFTLTDFVAFADVNSGDATYHSQADFVFASSAPKPPTGRAPSPGPTVFFGNSITEFGDWKRLLKDSAVVNRGIAADNTFGMLDRLSEVIALKSATLYIEAGINDIGQDVPPALIAANIGSMVQYVRVKSPRTKVYVLSVLPTNSHAQTDYPEIAGKNATVREVDQLLASQATARGYTYLDLASRVATPSGDLDERYAQPDGLHLNDAGYALWMDMIKTR